jgi:hypothetical protein
VRTRKQELPQWPLLPDSPVRVDLTAFPPSSLLSANLLPNPLPNLLLQASARLRSLKDTLNHHQYRQNSRNMATAHHHRDHHHLLPIYILSHEARVLRGPKSRRAASKNPTHQAGFNDLQPIYLPNHRGGNVQAHLHLRCRQMADKVALSLHLPQVDLHHTIPIRKQAETGD